MKNTILVIAVSFFLLSCGSNNTTKERSESGDTAGHMHKDAAAGEASAFHKEHIGDLHDAMEQMTDDIKKQDYTGDADYDFALLMKRHHQGAMDMAKCVIDNGEDEQIIGHAQKMTESHLADIQKFDKLIQSRLQTKGDNDFHKKATDLLSPLKDLKAEGTTLDQTYAHIIELHYNDGIKIAQEYLKTGKDAEMRAVAEKIIKQDVKELLR